MAACVRRSLLKGVNFSRLLCLQRADVAKSNIGLFASQRRYASNVNQDYQNSLSDDESSKQHMSYDQLYQGHIPTTPLQRGLLAFGSAVMCLYNPARDDMICALGESTGYYALKNLHNKMSKDPEGRLLLEEQPLINTDTVDIDYLGNLPEGTFGKAYWHFLDKNGFSPDSRLPVHFIDDPELVYVMLRYRQIHDLMHTLLGMPPNLLGEVAVKWVEFIQTGLPMCGLAAIFGPLRLGPKHRQKYINTYLSWALRCGRNSKLLMNVYFEKHWEKSLDDLRRELNVEPVPVPLASIAKTTRLD